MADFFDRLDKYMEYSGLNDNKLTVLAQLSVGALGNSVKVGVGCLSRVLREFYIPVPILMPSG